MINSDKQLLHVRGLLIKVLPLRASGDVIRVVATRRELFSVQQVDWQPSRGATKKGGAMVCASGHVTYMRESHVKGSRASIFRASRNVTHEEVFTLMIRPFSRRY